MCENSRTLFYFALTFNDFAHMSRKGNFQCITFCSTLKVYDTSIVKTISYRFQRVYWAATRRRSDRNWKIVIVVCKNHTSEKSYDLCLKHEPIKMGTTK